ncbi:neutral/alkaline non-lysosomal ceramidase N-terminal domain-containing protein [Candidatus Latescibacterota bacterium]
MKTYIKPGGCHKFLFLIQFCHIALVIFIGTASIEASEWKAGKASVIITPEESAWMAGYGARDKPSEGKIHDLYVKALALEDPEGNRTVIVTADLIGVTKDFSNTVSEEIEKRFGLPRNSVLFNTSHTHCGPEIRMPLPFYVPGEWESNITAYVKWLQTRYIRAISEAITEIKPARLSFSRATPVPFSVSRRFPSPEGILYRSGPSSYYTGGPRDDVVPVLRVTDLDGNIYAILFGYACHPITLNIYQFCGDYPGYAQRYVEEVYPGVTALFVQGCAGQLVPNARYQLEYAMGHGRALAQAVTNALEGEQIPINGPINCAYDEIPLDFQPLPERKILEDNLKSNNSTVRRKAAYFLKKLDNNESIETTIPFPIQTVRLGNELLLIGLFGEPVVEYAIKLKSEFLTYQYAWVAGYCNHGAGYLPTWKIQREGGYEGGDAMRNMPVPGPFTETVETRVLEGIRRLVKDVSD